MIKRGEYQGKPVISLVKTEDDKYPFTFGAAKARLILANIDEIRKFVEECDSGKPMTPPPAKKEEPADENPPF